MATMGLYKQVVHVAPIGYRRITSHGYAIIKVPVGHHLRQKNGYAYEHRLVAESKLGRPLNSDELVHHRNGNRLDNSIENVIVVDGIAGHKVHHRKRADMRFPGESNDLVLCACGCGESILKYDGSGRPRRYKHRHSCRKGTGKRNSKELICCACGCGDSMIRYDSCGREKRFISGHRKLMIMVEKLEKYRIELREKHNLSRLKPS